MHQELSQGKVLGTRQGAEYTGGDPNDAASFACVTRPDYFDLHNLGVQRAYQ